MEKRSALCSPGQAGWLHQLRAWIQNYRDNSPARPPAPTVLETQFGPEHTPIRLVAELMLNVAKKIADGAVARDKPAKIEETAIKFATDSILTTKDTAEAFICHLSDYFWYNAVKYPTDVLSPPSICMPAIMIKKNFSQDDDDVGVGVVVNLHLDLLTRAGAKGMIIPHPTYALVDYDTHWIKMLSTVRGFVASLELENFDISWRITANPKFLDIGELEELVGNSIGGAFATSIVRLLCDNELLKADHAEHKVWRKAVMKLDLAYVAVIAALKQEDPTELDGVGEHFDKIIAARDRSIPRIGHLLFSEADEHLLPPVRSDNTIDGIGFVRSRTLARGLEDLLDQQSITWERICDYSTVCDEIEKHFPPPWLKLHLDNWIERTMADAKRGYCLIMGPQSGKSAVAAHLFRTRKPEIAGHFFSKRYQLDHWLVGLRSIILQLCRIHRLERPVDDELKESTIQETLLAKLKAAGVQMFAEDRLQLIIIDGVDKANEPYKFINALPKYNLPKGVIIIVTTNSPGSDELDWLKNNDYADLVTQVDTDPFKWGQAYEAPSPPKHYKLAVGSDQHEHRFRAKFTENFSDTFIPRSEAGPSDAMPLDIAVIPSVIESTTSLGKPMSFSEIFFHTTDQRAIAFGGASCGKSTAARQLAWRIISGRSHPAAFGLPNGILPIWVRVKDISLTASNQKSNSRLLEACLPDCAVDVGGGLDIHRPNPYLWILDGLDELSDADLKRRVLNEIEDTREAQNRENDYFLITTRTQTKEAQEWKDYCSFHVMLLSREQQEEFIAQSLEHFGVVYEQSKKDIERKVKSLTGGELATRILASNPLALSTIIYLWSRCDTVPLSLWTKVLATNFGLRFEQHWQRVIFESEPHTPTFAAERASRILEALAWELEDRNSRFENKLIEQQDLFEKRLCLEQAKSIQSPREKHLRWFEIALSILLPIIIAILVLLVSGCSPTPSDQIEEECNYIMSCSFRPKTDTKETVDAYGAFNRNRIHNRGADMVKTGPAAMAAIGLMAGVTHLYEKGNDIQEYDEALGEFFLKWIVNRKQPIFNHVGEDNGAFYDKVMYDKDFGQTKVDPNSIEKDPPSPHSRATAQALIALWKYYEFLCATGRPEEALSWLRQAWLVAKPAGDFLVKMIDSKLGLVRINSTSHSPLWTYDSAYAVAALRCLAKWAQISRHPSHLGFSRQATFVADRVARLIPDEPEFRGNGFYSLTEKTAEGLELKYRGNKIDLDCFSPYEAEALSIQDGYCGEICEGWYAKLSSELKSPGIPEDHPITPFNEHKKTPEDEKQTQVEKTTQNKDEKTVEAQGNQKIPSVEEEHDKKENDAKKKESEERFEYAKVKLDAAATLSLARLEWKLGHTTGIEHYQKRAVERFEWVSDFLRYRESKNSAGAKVTGGINKWIAQPVGRNAPKSKEWKRYADTSGSYIQLALMTQVGVDTRYTPLDNLPIRTWYRSVSTSKTSLVRMCWWAVGFLSLLLFVRLYLVLLRRQRCDSIEAEIRALSNSKSRREMKDAD